MNSNFIKLSLSLLLLLVAGFSFSQTENLIVFKKTTQKFIRVEEGHQITLTYQFSYSGDQPLSIIPPVVDCSCTEVILPEEKITKNKAYNILIKFDTNEKIGYQERTLDIKFISNHMDSTYIVRTLKFKGVVKASKATKEKYKNLKD